MTRAFQFISYVFNKLITFVFDDALIGVGTGATLGWIMIVVIIFSIMIKNILSLGKVGQAYYSTKKEDKELWRENKRTQTEWYRNNM